jgi:endogenous inhibitor of DNA gyrase (YacG/DUF329 family)
MPANIRCPICRKTVPFNDPNMPFCSDRCRVIDLGNWASEVYSVPASESENELDESEGSSDRLPTGEELE